MKVEVLIDQADAHPAWVVCSHNVAVRFTNETAANAYAQRLESRLNAPHTWPGSHAPSLEANPLFAREMQPRAL